MLRNIIDELLYDSQQGNLYMCTYIRIFIYIHMYICILIQYIFKSRISNIHCFNNPIQEEGDGLSTGPPSHMQVGDDDVYLDKF
jgi:hypothetical protein